jgi:imidazoleglycerol phosphate synthase glutamine amidotransferase subunit HisH
MKKTIGKDDKNQLIGIIDYGLGNLHSVKGAVEKLGFT